MQGFSKLKKAAVGGLFWYNVIGDEDVRKSAGFVR